MEPVVEDQLEVKIIAAAGAIPCCQKCHGHGPEHSSAAERGKDVEEACLVKNNYFSQLSAKYRPEFTETRSLRSHRRKKGFYFLREECLNRRTLFVDDSFPPSNQAINFNGITTRQYQWKRPNEIVSNPEYFVGGATRFDIQQGELGDCWLLAAVSTLTLNPRLFHVVVPYDQGFHYKYAGIFHFRFWHYGKWEDVCIDDLLPTYRGQLVFMHSKTPNEFWCALLEKAYAKLFGCYEALRGGTVKEAMIDLTGGVVETIDLCQSPKNLFAKMSKATKREALMGCGIESKDHSMRIEGRLANGLISRHAYSVTKVAKVPYRQSNVELVRLHNPWGNDAEWTGAWSDQSQEWKSISQKEKLQLGITFDDDGEFWMPFQDFASNFTTLEICDITPDVFSMGNDDDDIIDNDEQLNQEQMTKQWKMKVFNGEWKRGDSAGGCRNFIDTFSMNPQYVVLLDEPEENSESCTLVVSLMQKYVRQMKCYGADYAPIGYALYRLPPGRIPGEPLGEDFFMYTTTSGRSPNFVNSREIAHHHKFPPGVYIIVPSTFEPNTEGEFLLRVFTETNSRNSSILRRSGCRIYRR